MQVIRRMLYYEVVPFAAGTAALGVALLAAGLAMMRWAQVKNVFVRDFGDAEPGRT